MKTSRVIFPTSDISNRRGAQAFLPILPYSPSTWTSRYRLRPIPRTACASSAGSLPLDDLAEPNPVQANRAWPRPVQGSPALEIFVKRRIARLEKVWLLKPPYAPVVEMLIMLDSQAEQCHTLPSDDGPCAVPSSDDSLRLCFSVNHILSSSLPCPLCVFLRRVLYQVNMNTRGHNHNTTQIEGPRVYLCAFIRPETADWGFSGFSCAMAGAGEAAALKNANWRPGSLVRLHYPGSGLREVAPLDSCSKSPGLRPGLRLWIWGSCGHLSQNLSTAMGMGGQATITNHSTRLRPGSGSSTVTPTRLCHPMAKELTSRSVTSGDHPSATKPQPTHFTFRRRHPELSRTR